MSKRIQCKWGRNFEFSKMVIAHFILKDHPEYKNSIDEKVEEWFSQFEGSDYEGDCLTTNKFSRWFESYFVDLGCDSKHVLPYVKDFLQCFSELGTSIYDEYKGRIMIRSLNDEEFLHRVPHCVYQHQYAQYANEVFHNIIPLKTDLFFDYDRAVETIESFDNEFDWISKYTFNAKWKIVFCLVVDFIYRCSCSEGEKEQKNKYDKVAGAFLTKYLVFEEFDTNFNKRKIQVNGVTMSIEDFVKKISDDLGGTAKKEGT